MNVMLISLGPLEQWMQLVYWPFSKDPMKSTVLAMWSFWASVTARPTKNWLSRQSMEHSQWKSLNVWNMCRSTLAHAFTL